MAKRFTVHSVEVSTPERVAAAAADLVAIVPTVTKMKVPGVGEQTFSTFLIAVSDDQGETWTFLDGTSHDEESIREVLPDFPDTLEFPQVEMPTPEGVRRIVARPAKQVAADMQTQLFRLAVEMYRLHVGSYPTTAHGLQALKTPPADLPNPEKWKGPYLRRPLPLDPWGNPYQYERDDKQERPKIWSFGPDGRTGTADDVVLDWNPEKD
jgi:general secretion pathway protein G